VIKPIEKDAELYKGATFKLEFRIKDDGNYTDTSLWGFTFKAVEKNSGGADVLATNSTDSPAGIVVDSADNYLITVTISAVDTAAITQTGQLYFEIDATNNLGEVERRWIGNINLIEAA